MPESQKEVARVKFRFLKLFFISPISFITQCFYIPIIILQIPGFLSFDEDFGLQLKVRSLESLQEI